MKSMKTDLKIQLVSVKPNTRGVRKHVKKMLPYFLEFEKNTLTLKILP